MHIRTIAPSAPSCLVRSGCRASRSVDDLPCHELKPGMVGIGRTVFEGDQLEEFKVHILGVLRNSIGPRRDLILARLEGGPLANTGVIAGMSGSPVYIDGRLVGAVSYSLGQFAKEPIAGITPIDEMIADATLPDSQRRAQVAACAAPAPSHAGGACAPRCVRHSRGSVRSPKVPPTCRSSATDTVNAGIGTLLRPIATPISVRRLRRARRSTRWSRRSATSASCRCMAGAAQLGSQSSTASAPSGSSSAPLRPGDPIGVALMNGDLEVGATGTVTEVDGNRVYAFGHPFYRSRPDAVPDDARPRASPCCPASPAR